MLQIDVKNSLGVMLFDSAFAKNDYETKEQKKNTDGMPMWSVNVLLRQPDSRRSENLAIVIPAPADPPQAIEPVQIRTTIC